MHYTKNGYDIEIDGSIFEDSYFRTSRYREPPINRPIDIYPGDTFWGLVTIYYKVTKDARGVYRSGLGYVLNSGVWISGWVIAKNGWQTSREGVWIPASGKWEVKAFVTRPAVYSAGSMGNSVAYDARMEIWIGEVFNPNNANDVHWYTDHEPVSSSWMVIANDDAEVFRNKLFQYSFDVAQPVPARV